MTSSNQSTSNHASRLTSFLLASIAVAFLLSTTTGCQSTGSGFSFGKLNTGPVDFDPTTTVRAASADDEKPGLLDRMILGKGEPIRWPGFGRRSKSKKQSLAARLASRERLDRDSLNRAQSLYEKSDYAAAAKLFAVVAKERNPKKFRLFDFTKNNDRPVYDPVREEAVFYLAESQFMQKRLVDAHDQYRVLIKEFPQSRYMDGSARRLFDIAQRWLSVEDFATPGEIEQVSFDGSYDKPLSVKKPKKKPFGWLPNLTDPSEPALDKSGHAVDALKTIWLNDPTGPLADDALMLASTHHLRVGRYREAARLLKILREEFPKSPHLKNAFAIGSQVELMSYQGSSYDEQNLLESRDLKESTLRLFPGIESSDLLRRELKGIEEERARREWDRILFWEKKKKPKAVAIYCRELLQNFPNSRYGGLAQQKLVELGEAEAPRKAGGPGSTPGRVPLGNPDRAVRPFQSQPATPAQPAPYEDDGPVFEPTQPIIDTPQPSSPPVGRVRL
jgi:outer membrane protein assembly factor BamD (BamD/ComL family)